MNPENELTVTAYKYNSNPCLKDTDFDGLDDGKGSEYLDELLKNKLPSGVTYLEMQKDKNPLSNYFTGRMNSTRLSGDDAIKVDMNMDYRYFLMSNKNYYDELSTMSLLYANSIYKRGKDQELHSGLTIFNDNNLCTDEEKNKGIEFMTDNGKNYKNLQVKGMMEHFGFQNVKVYYLGNSKDEGYDVDEAGNVPECRNYTDTHKGAVALGYRNIEYHGIEKSVIGIIIRGTAEDNDWDCDFDVGDIDLRDAILNTNGIEPGYGKYFTNFENIEKNLSSGILNKYDPKYSNELLHFAYGYPDWIHRYHHAGFDIVANRILEILEEYINSDDCAEMDGDMIFWVTGHRENKRKLDYNLSNYNIKII